MKKRKLLILVMAVILLLPVGAVYAEGEDFEDILNAQIKVLQEISDEELVSIKMQLLMQNRMDHLFVYEEEVTRRYEANLEQLKKYYYEGEPPMYSNIREMVFSTDYVNSKYDEKYLVFLAIDNLMYERDGELNYFLKDMRTFVPLRFISEKLGFTVEYVEDTKDIIIKKDDVVIKIKLGEASYTLNGEVKTMDTEPIIEGDLTYVPVRFVAEALGYNVEWDEQYFIVNVVSKEKDEAVIVE